MKHIIYIHGLGSTGKIFNYLTSSLPKHKSTFIEYDSALPINEIFNSIQSIIPRNESITIVGHSLGGIIGLLIASQMDDVLCDRLISISTPYGGSETAAKMKWFFPGFKILRDISPKSDILNKLLSVNISHFKFTSIISTAGHMPFVPEINDGVVSICSQRASRSTDKIEIKSNHFEALQDNETVSMIKQRVFL